MTSRDLFIANVQPAHPITARDENFKRAILRRGFTSGASVESTAGAHARGVAIPSTGQAEQRMQVISELDDHLLCVDVNIDGSSPGTVNIKVMKPYWLQRTPWDGKQRFGIKYYYDGTDPETGGTPVFNTGNPLPGTRLAKRDGDSRDSGGNPLREREIQEVRPIWYNVAEDEVSLDDIGGDLIWVREFEEAIGSIGGEDVFFVDANRDPARFWYGLCVQHTPENTT